MKKIIYSICLLFLLGIFMPNVNAEGNVLVPFSGDSETSQMSSNSSYVLPTNIIKIGDTINYTILSCNPDEATISNGIITFSKNKCSSDNINVTWVSSNPSVASVENGSIHILGIGTTTITATTEGYDPVTIAITISETANNESSSNQSTSTSDEIPNMDDEEDKLIENNKKTSKTKTELVPKTSYEGKQTTLNPKTGVNDILIYIIPISIIGGTVLTLKRRCIN